MSTKITYTKLPLHTRRGMKLYLEEGVRPGGFLYAILTGDIEDAKARADLLNLVHIPDFLDFLETEAPRAAYGSVEKVEAWIKGREP